ncbi:MAG: hypothetical protein RLZZ500_1236 [Bacteroidota bacterium]|jgi:hypothetical protein
MRKKYVYTRFILLLLGLHSVMGIPVAQAQTPCLDPIDPIIISLSATEVTIQWTQPNPNPWNGYDYYLTQSSQVPNTNTTPTGTVTQDNVTLNVQVGGTYRFYVRSNCGSATGSVKGPWQGYLTFTPIPTGSGCAQAPYGMHPTTMFVPAYTQQPELINADAYAGEFCRVDVMANRQYEFTTDRSTDYITITNFNGSVVYAHGVNPVIYNSGTNDTEIRYYISANSMCLTQASERERYVTARLVPSTTCPSPSNLTTTSISTTGAIANWVNNAPGVITSFQYYYSTNATPPNINATPSGNTTFSTFTMSSLNPNTTYFYWVRSICDQELTPWIAGSPFTTQATPVLGCTTALYGQTPPTVFVPACTGVQEIIATNMWAGNYSQIDILPNKTYTFTSSVGTDFITIRDNDTSIAYASGPTPLVWSSGANTARIKMFVHLNSSCSTQNVNRTTTITCQNATANCSTPSGLTITTVTANSVTATWTSGSPSPNNGYQYWISTTTTTPSSGTTPTGTTATTSVTASGLTASTTYYFWVRANCGSATSQWVFGTAFTTVGTGLGCTNAPNGQFPVTTFSPACFGNDEVIVTNAYAGEYTVVNILSNTQYTFKSSVTSDYITITNSDASVVYTAGTTPLIWNSGNTTGTIRYYFHANAACATQNTDRTRYIACQTAAPACASPSGGSFSAITATTATANWTAANPAPSTGYQVYLSTNATAPTSNSTPLGTVTSNGALLSGLIAQTTYYIWVRSDCGTTQSAWVLIGNFTTTAASAGCTTAVNGLYPTATFTPTCNGTSQNIVSDAWTGEYSNISVTTNTQYTFSSSVTTDYITITNTDGSVVYAVGVTPLVWNSSGVSGIIRYYLHSDANCTTANVNRIRRISCTPALNVLQWEAPTLFKANPNPVYDIVDISGQLPIDTIRVLNPLGQTISILNVHAQTQYRMDCSNYATGMYTLVIESKGTSQILRIVKQ